MLKNLAPHAARMFSELITASGLDDERNETVELIAVNCLNKPVLMCDLL